MKTAISHVKKLISALEKAVYLNTTDVADLHEARQWLGETEKQESELESVDISPYELLLNLNRMDMIEAMLKEDEKRIKQWAASPYPQTVPDYFMTEEARNQLKCELANRQHMQDRARPRPEEIPISVNLDLARKLLAKFGPKKQLYKLGEEALEVAEQVLRQHNRNDLNTEDGINAVLKEAADNLFTICVVIAAYPQRMQEFVTESQKRAMRYLEPESKDDSCP